MRHAADFYQVTGIGFFYNRHVFLGRGIGGLFVQQLHLLPAANQITFAGVKHLDYIAA